MKIFKLTTKQFCPVEYNVEENHQFYSTIETAEIGYKNAIENLHYYWLPNQDKNKWIFDSIVSYAEDEHTYPRNKDGYVVQYCRQYILSYDFDLSNANHRELYSDFIYPKFYHRGYTPLMHQNLLNEFAKDFPRTEFIPIGIITLGQIELD